MGLLHLSSNLKYLKETYPEHMDLWKNLTYLTFFAGVNYNRQLEGNRYIYEVIGFIVILIFCVIERKAQVWLSNKFGYEGSFFDTYEGKIRLDTFTSDLINQEKKLRKMSTGGELEPIEEHYAEDSNDFLVPKISNKINFSKSSEKEETKKKKEEEKVRTPEEEFESTKKEKCKRVIYIEHYISIAKAFRILIFVASILMSLLTTFYKCNIWGAMIIITVALFSF